LRAEQEKDADVSVVTNWLETGTSPTEVFKSSPAVKYFWLHQNQLQIQTGVLFYRWDSPGSPPRYCLVIPETQRGEILANCHDAKTAGHLGQDKTLARVRKSFHWFGMTQDVPLYVATCAICSKNKKTPKAKAALRSYLAGFPLERVHLDILGPLTPAVRVMFMFCA
jgi:hypothetical protein